MRVRVEEREDASGQVCPLCRAALAGAVWTCDRCGAGLHAECARELPRCPTLACPGRPTQAARAPERGPSLPRRPLAPAGEARGTAAPLTPALSALWNGLAVLGVLGLVGMLVLIGAVVRWVAPPPTSPTRSSGLLQRETVVLARATLRGDPPRMVQLEKAWYLELRVDGETRPLQWLGWLAYQGVAPFPGREVDLLHFRSSGAFSRDVWLGITRDGRLVVVRESLGTPAGEDARGPQPLDAQDPQRGPPAPPANTPAEWVAVLRGDDPVAAIDALGWLALPASPGPHLYVPAAAREVLARARAAPEVHQAVEDLRDAPEPWIREAAEQAAARLE